MPVSVSIVIPTWNGRALLERFLPSVIDAAGARHRSIGAPVEIVVADDGSTDDTIAWVHEVARTCPVPLRLVRHARNLGFSKAANLGIQEARHPFVWLLNNDVEVDVTALHALTRAFEGEHSRVFAVHSAMVDIESGEVVGTGKMGGFSKGFFRVHRSFIPATEADDDATFPSMFATGGSAMFQRGLFLQLGGFDSIFSPFYMEDVELSYRAWKQGYEVRFAPASVVRHQFSSTIGPRAGHRVERISQRNRLLFHWIHLQDLPWAASHLAWLTLLTVTAPFTFRFNFLAALFDALRATRSVRRRRGRASSLAKRSDRDVLKVFRRLDASGSVQSYGEKREVDLAAFRQKKRPA